MNKYKITFLGCPVGSLLRKEYTEYFEIDENDRNVIINKVIYQGQNKSCTKYTNIDWNSITIKRSEARGKDLPA